MPPVVNCGRQHPEIAVERDDPEFNPDYLSKREVFDWTKPDKTGKRQKNRRKAH